MKQVDLSNVQEATEFVNLPAGGYICEIVKVEDCSDKEYLKIFFDIAEGEYKNYYSDLSDRIGSWGGIFVKSYKQKALPFFKAMVTAIENSNSGYKFNGGDEQSFKGKFVGIVLGEEEYINKYGEVKVAVKAGEIKSTASIREKKYKIPEKKPIKPDNTYTYQNSSIDIYPEAPLPDDDDIPF